MILKRFDFLRSYLGGGKSALAVARQFRGCIKNFNGERFWARAYAVLTVGFEKEQIKGYIKNQQQLDGQGSDGSGNTIWRPLWAAPIRHATRLARAL